MTLFEDLSESYVLTAGTSLLPIDGYIGSGLSTCVFPDLKSGVSFIDDHFLSISRSVEKLGFGEPDLNKIGDPLKLMRRAAGEGMGGMQVVRIKNEQRYGIGRNTLDGIPEMNIGTEESHELAETFMFMVRVEEGGELFPTILTALTDDGWGHSLTQTGVLPIPHSDLFHWERYDIMDQLSGQFVGQTCPFLTWKQGDPLYELRGEGTTVLLAHVNLLGDWNSPDGSFAFFTGEEYARYYHQWHLGDGNNKIMKKLDRSKRSTNPATNDNDAHGLMDSLRPVPVHDLNSRLAELREVWGLAGWCINPLHPRYDAGYGRLFEGMPGSMLSSSTVPVPQMITVSGHWLVAPGNMFKMETPLDPWTGYDTIRWSGGQALPLAPLDPTFVSDPKSQKLENLTESDIEAYVEQHVMQDAVETNHVYVTPQHKLDEFHLATWDTVTGDSVVIIFANVLEALQYLAQEERDYDREYRVAGASSKAHIGFMGSGNADFELVRSQRFQLGIRRIALRVLKEGYNPKCADDIVALCNAALRTLHVVCAGFPKDLIWQCGSGMVEHVCKLLDVNEDIYREWEASVDPSIESAGKKLVLERMEVEVWNLLSRRSQSFLATAFCDLENRGYASKLDYAPVNMQIVKALETELGIVLVRFRQHVGDNIPNCDDSRHEKSLIKFIKNGGRPPSIGAMSHLFRKPGTNTSDLSVALHGYLISHENHQFLMSSKFAVDALNRVIHKCRNSGVHDSIISKDTCKECVDDLIGTYQKPGYLQLLFVSDNKKRYADVVIN